MGRGGAKERHPITKSILSFYMYNAMQGHSCVDEILVFGLNDLWEKYFKWDFNDSLAILLCNALISLRINSSFNNKFRLRN